MDNEQKIKLIKCCKQVASDMANDAKEFDGKPFDGKTVAQYLGYQGAAIAALSNVIKQVIENEKPERHNPSNPYDLNKAGFNSIK